MAALCFMDDPHLPHWIFLNIADDSVGHTHLSHTVVESRNIRSIIHCPSVPYVHIIHVFRVVEV